MEEKREDAPHDVSNPGGKPNNINGAAANDEQPIKDFLGRLTLNDKLTLLVAVGSLAVALLGYVNSLDTSKLSEAVSHLSDLANKQNARRTACATNSRKSRRRPPLLLPRPRQLLPP